jgi:hypothetical protein
MNKSTTQFFQTGPLSRNLDELRISQGLPPQTLANQCAFSSNGQPSGLATSLYPAGQTPLPTYGLKPISNQRSCVRWLRTI